MKASPFIDQEKQTENEQQMAMWNQRQKERREKCTEGFAYISTVGWICRREQNRRKDDCYR